MKKSLLLLSLALSSVATLSAQSRQLVKKWETEPVLKTPESVLFDAGGRVLYVSNIDGKHKSRTTVVDGMDASTDGVEHVQGDEFIVSCWAGAVYHVKGGEKQQLLDSRPQKLNSADLGYDAKNRMVCVPTFFANTVVAYELK